MRKPAKWRQELRYLTLFALFVAQSWFGQSVTGYKHFWFIQLCVMIFGLVTAILCDTEYADAALGGSSGDRSYLTYFGHAVVAGFMWVWAFIVVCVILPYRGWKSLRQWVYETSEDISHTLGG